MEDNKLDLINGDGQDSFIFHGILSYEQKVLYKLWLYKRRK